MQPAAIVRAAGARLYKSYTKNVNATATLATILGEALPAAVVAVKITHRAATVLRYQHNAAADANCASLVQNETETFYGDKAQLDRLQFYTGGTNSADFSVYV
jgi:hypothetical protein